MTNLNWLFIDPSAELKQMLTVSLGWLNCESSVGEKRSRGNYKHRVTEDMKDSWLDGS